MCITAIRSAKECALLFFLFFFVCQLKCRIRLRQIRLVTSPAHDATRSRSAALLDRCQSISTEHTKKKKRSERLIKTIRRGGTHEKRVSDCQLDTAADRDKDSQILSILWAFEYFIGITQYQRTSTQERETKLKDYATRLSPFKISH